MKVAGVIFKGLAIVLMIVAPLLGVWVASSLAAYANARVGLVVASGALLFPILPLTWLGLSEWRRRRGTPKPHMLTFGDRLIIRTLVINVLFIGVLLAAQPKRGFVALAARGDWFLNGRHGALSDAIRRGAFKIAGTLEWLYNAKTEKNPYEQYDTQSQTHPDKGSYPKLATDKVTMPAPKSDATDATMTPASWPSPNALHPIVQNMPAEAEQSIESVGHYIAAHEKDPVLRIKALHDWVADRIVYDAPAFLSGNIPFDDGDAQKTFARRLGVCAGYAQLLAALGRASGDEIVYVVGNVRERGFPVDGLSHAWNAVRIDGTWHLIDATFDAGYLEGDKYKKHYTSDYLFTPPDVFGVSHFPNDKSWQLRDTPISRGDFIRQPMLRPAFFAHHLTLVSPDRSQVTVSGHLDVVVKNPDNAQLLVDFGPALGGTGQPCKVIDTTHAACELPSGAWQVTLFGNANGGTTFDYFGAFDVNSR